MPGIAQPIQPIHILGWARRVPRTSCAVSKPHRSNCELYSIMLHPVTSSSCAVSYLHQSICELYSIQLIHILPM